MSLVAPSMRGGYLRYLSAEWRDVFIGRLVLRLQSVVLVEAAVALCYVGVVTAFAFRFGDFRLWTTFVALASFFFILSVLGLGLSASKARDHRRLRVLSLIVGVSIAGAAWRIFTTVKLIHYLCDGHGAPLDVDSSLDYECRKDFIAWTLVLCILFIVVGIPIISMGRVLRVRIERAIAFMDLDHDTGRPERDRRARRERVEELIVYVNESDVEDSEECVVCFDKPKNAVLLECGHLQICIDCARLMDACPVCRKNITSIIHRRVRVRSHNGDEPNDSDDVNVANDSGDDRAVEAGQRGEGGGGREEEGSGVPATATTASPAAGSTPSLESPPPPPPPPPPAALPRSGVEGGRVASSAQLSGPLNDGAWIGGSADGGGSGGEGAGAPAGGPLGPTTGSDGAKGRVRGGDGEGRRERERERSRQRKERKAAKKSSKRTARHGESDLSKRLAVSSSSRSASASSSPSSAALTSSSSSSSSTISATSYSRSSGSSSLASPPGLHGLSHTSPRPLRSHAAGTSAPSAISLGLSPREGELLPASESARKGKKAVRKSTRKEGTTKSSSRRKHGGGSRTEGGGGRGGGEGGGPSRSTTRGEAGGGRSGRPLKGSESGSSPSSGRVGSSRDSRTASSSSSRSRSRASVTSSSSSSSTSSSSSSLSFARRRGGGGGLAKGGTGGGAESAAVGAGIGSSGKKANSNKKKKLCPKCNDGSPICMLVPCGHQFCESCARTQLTNCFTCTAPISKRVVLY